MDGLKKLSLAISAALVAGSVAGDANALNRFEFGAVREYVENRDVAGLRDFVAQNPQVLDNSPMGQELRNFMDAPPPSNLFVVLGLQNPIPRSMRDMVERGKRDGSIY